MTRPYRPFSDLPFYSLGLPEGTKAFYVRVPIYVAYKDLNDESKLLGGCTAHSECKTEKEI